MSSSGEGRVRASAARCTESDLIIELVDERVFHVPIVWFPRLAAATRAQRADLRLIGDGEGIHWPRLDEDLAVESLLLPEAEIRRGYRPLGRDEPRSRRPGRSHS